MSASDAAQNAITELLHTHVRRVPALRVDSPAGAGKTHAIESLAALSLSHLNERCTVATPTNAQAFDIARRFATRFPSLQAQLLVRQGKAVPVALGQLANLQVVEDRGQLRPGPSLLITNVRKLETLSDDYRADVLIVDEAFQVRDANFIQVAGLADRLVLVGDPGQISPVVTAAIERWCDDPAGPHVACPKALAHRRGHDLARIALPVSRRLVPDTVRIVQPALYPRLPFRSICGPDERRLALMTQPRDCREVLDLLHEGHSIVLHELPSLATGESDPDLADTVVRIAVALLESRATCHDGDVARLLTPSDIGVICAHVSQVANVRQRLPRELADVHVETADRFQGLEREVTIVHHPLSGRGLASEFHLDTGRLCVMLTRHRTACVVVAREGIDELLDRHAPVGNRVLGVAEDQEYEGWTAHRRIIGTLRERGSVTPAGVFV